MSAACVTTAPTHDDVTTAADAVAVVKFFLECVTTGIFCLSGLVGNLLCLAALCQDRTANSNTHLLSALAVFDWLMLVALFSCVSLPEYCRFYSTCSGYLTSLRREGVASSIWVATCMVQTASIWMVVAVTVDRFLAVCLPLKFRMTSARRRSSTLISFVVVLSVLFNLPRFFHNLPVTTSSGLRPDHTTSERPPTNTTNTSTVPVWSHDDRSCAVASPTAASVTEDSDVILLSQTIWYNYVYYISLSWLVFYIVPIISLVVLNIILIRQIRRAQRKRIELAAAHVARTSASNRCAPGGRLGRSTSRDNISLTINIVAMVTVFIICQTPDFVLTLLSYRGLAADVLVLKVLRGLCYCLLALNSSVNFLIYCLFYRRFRVIVGRMVCWRPLRRLLNANVSSSSIEERNSDLNISTTTKQTLCPLKSLPGTTNGVRGEEGNGSANGRDVDANTRLLIGTKSLD